MRLKQALVTVIAFVVVFNVLMYAYRAATGDAATWFILGPAMVISAVAAWALAFRLVTPGRARA